jgi:hypothetical protein
MGMIMYFRLMRRMLMLVSPVLSGMLMGMHMGVSCMSMLVGMLVQMLMCVRVGMVMQVNYFLVLVFMAVTFPMSVLG